jgi:hypothetical protein
MESSSGTFSSDFVADVEFKVMLLTSVGLLSGMPITKMLYMFLLINIKDKNVRIITFGPTRRFTIESVSGYSYTRSSYDG